MLVGGSIGTSFHVLVGTCESERRAVSSACHGAEHSMSRHQATRWKGRQLGDALAAEGVLIRSPSARSVSKETPGAHLRKGICGRKP
jgi:tRNA-splicing ligase RtcB